MQTLQQLRSGELKGAVSLKLSEELTHFPEEIFELAGTLEMLDLSRNQLHSLPDDFGRLKKLKIFFCSENLFTVLPEVLADCPLLDIVGFKSNIIETVPAKSINANLRWFILTNNRVKEIPAEIGNCLRMQKLMLAGNRLTSLPEGLSRCSNLSLLRISANRLDELPRWLLSMPKLSWLAFSGNPFSEKPVLQPMNLIDWADLKINQLLGEGASGFIYKADWLQGDETDEIAVKLFKGAVTSDGLPEDEMNAYIASGFHPGLIKLLGQISGHPEGKTGLVMQLIPDRFVTLGITPSFESCTRDVYPEDMTLPLAQAVKIATTIASLAAQFHGKGIIHADLYAHNILIDDEGNTLFGDFGAAGFYNKADSELAAALERLEVSAFGYLLDDLIGLCKSEQPTAVLNELKELSQVCLHTTVLSRPDFNYLATKLASLKL